MSWISYVLNSGSADTPALANVGFLVFRFLKTENPEKSNLVFIVFFNSRFLENCKFKLFLKFSLTKSAVLST